MAANKDRDDSEDGAASRAAEPIRRRASGPSRPMRRRASRTGDVTRQATDQLAVYPVGAVVGGFLVGALLGFLLPRTEREDDLLGTTGRGSPTPRARRRSAASRPAGADRRHPRQGGRRRSARPSPTWSAASDRRALRQAALLGAA